MADTVDSGCLLHAVNFNHFCRKAYIENKKASSVVTREHATAIKHFLRKDYGVLVAFFNAETWDEVDELQLARFKFNVRKAMNESVPSVCLRLVPARQCPVTSDNSLPEQQDLVQLGF